jgi:hypothetical protein
MPELPQQQSPKQLPKWPDLPPCRPFEPRDELVGIVARLQLQADDFGCADCAAPTRRAVVRLP